MLSTLSTQTPSVQNELDPATFTTLLGLVYRHTGITMNESKKTLLEGRLRPRMRALTIGSFRDYVQYLERNSDEVQNFINMVTTNQTSFFRTAKVWNYFADEFLPEWHKQNSGKTLRIWSAAASTGEEAYSIAMCCHEYKQRTPTFDYSILATDISTKALGKAESGIYKGDSLKEATDRNTGYERYFIAVADGHKILPVLRDSIHFNKHSLFDAPPRTRYFDIVFLRNVMIYFGAAEQERVLKNIAASMLSGGILIIGESESLTRLNTNFVFKSPMIYTNG